MLYIFLQAYAAARAVTQPSLRLAACTDVGYSPQRAAAAMRRCAVVMLNRVLLEPSECETTTDDELVAWLGPKDPRTVHVRDHIGPQSGGTLRAGLLDGGTTDSARVAWVHGESEAEDGAAEEQEPTLKYTRLGGSVPAILSADAATCLAAHSKFLALGTEAGSVHVLDLSGHEIRKFTPHSAGVSDICIDPTGEFVGSCSQDGTVVVSSLLGGDATIR